MQTFVRAGALIVVLIATSGVAGCGDRRTSTVVNSSSAAPVAPSAPMSPSPSPTVDVAGLQAQIKAAVMPRGAMASVDGPKTSDSDDGTTKPVSQVCKSAVDVVSNWHGSYGRKWSGPGWYVLNTVHGYDTATGADIVKMVEASANSCQEYAFGDVKFRMLQPLTLPTYPGTEARFAFCEDAHYPDSQFIACYALLARGRFVSVVMVLRGETYRTASNGLLLVGALAAKALQTVKPTTG